MSARAQTVPTGEAPDFFEWTQVQAGRLRQLRASRDDLPADLDLDTIAEEIEDLGRAELHAVESLIRNILVHLAKAVSDPKAEAYAHWRTETRIFRIELRRKYTPAMRQRIDLDAGWRDALDVASDALREHGALLADNLPSSCPLTIDALLSATFDFDEAVSALRGLSAGGY